MKTRATTPGDSKNLHESETALRAVEPQSFTQLRRTSIALESSAERTDVQNLSQLLADTITLRDLYKKHHWQVSGPTFAMLHVLFDKHAAEQTVLVDLLAERIQILGGVAIAMGADVAEATIIPRPPIGCETTAAQIRRLLHAHEVILLEARAMARAATAAGDDGTADVIVSNVIRTGEFQVWFIAQHAEPAAVDPASSVRERDHAAN